MFTSSAEVFRTRQALRDLAEAVGVHRDAVQRLGSTGADRDAIERIAANDGRIDPETHRDIYSSILLAAALPEEDFGAFIGATAILLADLLQRDEATDDLFWNWDAFRDHYRLADPPVRAAVMNGFRLTSDLKTFKLIDPPSEMDCLTFAKSDVIITLQSTGQDEIATAISSDMSPEAAGELWHRAQPSAQPWQVLAGYRYLYERPASIAPPTPGQAQLIPWV